MVENKFIFYGVRGSYPVPSIHTAHYGGNTASILVEAGADIIILDAGTGIINIGKQLRENYPQRKHIDIFLTHLHIDHIQGIPFFEPVFDRQYVITIHSNQTPDTPLEKTIFALFNQPLSPIGNAGIKARIEFNVLDTVLPRPVAIGPHIILTYIKDPLHPTAGVLFYKVTIGGKHLVYATDVESPDGFSAEHVAFIEKADVLIHDSMYFEWDYFSPAFSKKGFGHSTVSMAVANAIRGKVNKLFLFHYNPNYSDTDLEQMLTLARATFAQTYLSEELKKFSLRR